jgi:hypothetical protein
MEVIYVFNNIALKKLLYFTEEILIQISAIISCDVFCALMEFSYTFEEKKYMGCLYSCLHCFI